MDNSRLLSCIFSTRFLKYVCFMGSAEQPSRNQAFKESSNLLVAFLQQYSDRWFMHEGQLSE